MATAISHSSRSIPDGESMSEHVCSQCGYWWASCDCPEEDDDDDA